MIRVFIDGPIAGDVRTDFPASIGPVVRVPIPRRVTTCDCNPHEAPTDFEDGPEVVDYHAIAHGPHVAIMSSSGKRDDQALIGALNAWVTTDLSQQVWIRHCRDRRAFT
jgi:hypothetical protein